jgi:hypothetical protein
MIAGAGGMLADQREKIIGQMSFVRYQMSFGAEALGLWSLALGLRAWSDMGDSSRTVKEGKRESHYGPPHALLDSRATAPLSDQGLRPKPKDLSTKA